jgi:hypothetical protein
VRRADTERRARAKKQRTRRLGLVGGGALLAVGAVAAVVALGGVRNGGAAGSGLAPGEISGPFGQHYAGLKARLGAAVVSTMMDTMSSRAHFHPRLTLLVDGKQLTVPANIGIDPRVDGMQMASLHTHDATGIIHVEGMERATLGEFFAVWGVPLSADQLGSYRQPVRMWVDGRRSRAYGNLQLADGQRIILAVGPGDPKL